MRFVAGQWVTSRQVWQCVDGVYCEVLMVFTVKCWWCLLWTVDSVYCEVLMVFTGKCWWCLLWSVDGVYCEVLMVFTGKCWWCLLWSVDGVYCEVLMVFTVKCWTFSFVWSFNIYILAFATHYKIMHDNTKVSSIMLKKRSRLGILVRFVDVLKPRGDRFDPVLANYVMGRCSLITPSVVARIKYTNVWN